MDDSSCAWGMWGHFLLLLGLDTFPSVGSHGSSSSLPTGTASQGHPRGSCPSLRAQRARLSPTVGLCSSSALTGVLFGNRDVFFSFLQRKQGSKPALCCDRGVTSLCCVQSFDPATHQDVFAEVLPPESCLCICCRGKRNKPGEKMGPPSSAHQAVAFERT